MVATALVLPFTSVGELLGFQPLPPAYFAVLVPLVAIHLLAVELVKRWFFRRYTRARPLSLGSESLRSL